MERIPAVQFQGTPQKYIAQLDVTTESIESSWGAHEVTYDDLGPWLTFSFSLEDGTLAALVREVENAPHPGYILTAISNRPSPQILENFISEAGIDSESVLHESDE